MRCLLWEGRVAMSSDAFSFGGSEALLVEDVMQMLHLSRNTVYKLARSGELPSFKVGRQLRFRPDDVRAHLARLSQPQPDASGAPDGPAAFDAGDDPQDALPPWTRGSLLLGGNDIAIDVLANCLTGLGVKALAVHTSDYLSLTRMYLGSCHAAAISLWSEADGVYNAPYVRRLLPGVPAIVFRLYRRKVGFAVPTRNPKGLSSWIDLLGDGVELANRELGSGSRVLLDEKLKYLEANGFGISGYDRPVTSELAQALVVARGMANVAVMTEKTARQTRGLDFVPLQDEVVDLVVLKTPQTTSLIKAVRSLLRADPFRQQWGEFCDVRLMGEVVYEC